MTVTRLLDVSRLISRAGLGHTGVDRVEFAYLSRFARDGQNWGLARTALGFVLLDQSGLTALVDAIECNDWGRVDLLSRWNRRLTPAARKGQSLVRRHAVGRCRPAGLAAMLCKHINTAFSYYNVGHSNLTLASLRAIKTAKGQISVLVHDTIPLDWPKMQRAGTVAAFEKKLNAADQMADRIICSTHAATADLSVHLTAKPPVVVAPLGVTISEPEKLPPNAEVNQPFFLSVGTIEPRKNHALLLDIWDDWIDAPQLVICGRRGWNNEDVFDRLDRGVPNVLEIPDVSDGQLSHLMSMATALVFPSFAEGFGLPPVEALALGTPVIVSDLPACREVLGDAAVYLDPSDRYGWKKTLQNMALGENNGTKTARVPPDWDTHFKLVLTHGW